MPFLYFRFSDSEEKKPIPLLDYIFNVVSHLYYHPPHTVPHISSKGTAHIQVLIALGQSLHLWIILLMMEPRLEVCFLLSDFLKRKS